MTLHRIFAVAPIALVALSLAGAARSQPPAAPSSPTPEPASAPQADAPYAGRDDVLRFIDDVAQRHGLEPTWLRAALERARYQPSVARLVMPAPRGTAKNWAAYRARFLDAPRLRAGAAFWREHRRWLDLAQQRYGVPPHIVVGIIGVETLYGRHLGNYRIIDALATLAFDFPNGRSDRSALFRDELAQFFVMCRRLDVSPLEWRGSYAGAIGMPQFLPSSVNRYAVDFDGDGSIDLHANAADVIGSVAHYLAAHGWQRGMATHYTVVPPPDPVRRATMLEPDIVPSFRADELAAAGARLAAESDGYADLLALVELENGDDAPSYVAGTPNFYVVTRYNRSSYYALAVIELGETIARMLDGSAAPGR